MTYQEILANARTCMGPYCKSCPVCNGAACKSTIPGPGAKDSGTMAMHNYQKWQEIRLNLDTICESKGVDTAARLFGKDFVLPVFVAPIGGVKSHYGDKHSEAEYSEMLVSGCAAAGIAAFTADGVGQTVMEGGVAALKQHGGWGIPTVKPWDMDTVCRKMEMIRQVDPIAVAMDIDASGLRVLKGRTPPAGSKSVEELRRIAAMTDKPFIVKGVMTVKGALKALEAGAGGIVVSNHGGRVLDGGTATAEVLPAIADAVGGKLTVLVDGGIRTGVDVFRALALGADGVLIGRPFVSMVYGGGAEGVKVYVDKLKGELEDAMAMCGAHSLAEIDRSMLFGY